MRKSVFVLVLVALFGFHIDSFAQDETVSEKVQPGLLTEKGATMVGRRNFVIEPGFQYTHISSNRLDVTGVSVLPALVVGIIEVEKIRRDILIPSLTFRLGLTDAFEFNLKIPYVARYDRYTFGADSLNTENQLDRITERVDETGLGDIEGGLLVHLLKERDGMPGILAGLRVKSRTGKDPYGLRTKEVGQVQGAGRTINTELPLGSGHWALEPNVTIVKTVDPAVFFLNLSYFDHIETDPGDGIGTVDPSDSINIGFGLAYALNDRFALSTAYEQKFYDRTEVDGKKIAETDITTASLVFGGTYLMTNKVSLNVSVSFGLTPDSPDTQVSLKLPIRLAF
ncbi:hypothetical protein DESUT3_21420 [Desulfuromonas versatilis]|uniref:Transporter n=1 Tax=Desulfuromonas versatilis TaxID=2802975 RepID=A0ABN6DY61_9BACT|nr:transporter [Desulfuromonas versatilis]BCR05073.1 hypothetical protein DESUT3_21420 [Desulfuromonas versatilis]